MQIPTESLANIADDLVPVWHKGRRPELQISLESLLAEPFYSQLAILTWNLEPVASDSTAKENVLISLSLSLYLYTVTLREIFRHP